MIEISSTTSFVGLALLFLVYTALNAFIFRTWNYFTKRGMTFDRGMPILGSFATAMLKREPLAITIERIYQRYSKHKFIGVYQMGGKPIYLVNDPELIKAITIKDFDHFVNHGFQIDANIDPLFGRNLFNMSDERWRDMRSILSPLFTGSKMRGMLALMNDTISEFASDIEQELKAAGPGGREYPLMKIYSSCTTDVIASCAFGLKINSYRDPTNEFFSLGQEVAYAFQSPKLFFSSCFPRLAKLLRTQLLSTEQATFFRDIVNHNLEQRKKSGVARRDMLHLLQLMREGRLDTIVDKDQDQDAGFATVQEMMTAKSTEKLKSKLKFIVCLFVWFI